MTLEKVNVGKSVSCDGCVGQAVGNREVCKSLPACFDSTKLGNLFNVVFVNRGVAVDTGAVYEGAK